MRSVLLIVSASAGSAVLVRGLELCAGHPSLAMCLCVRGAHHESFGHTARAAILYSRDPLCSHYCPLCAFMADSIRYHGAHRALGTDRRSIMR
jgi:hypothetical protein